MSDTNVMPSPCYPMYPTCPTYPPTCPMYPTCPMEHLEAMYPEIYHRVNPVVMQCCEMYDVPTNPGFCPYPTRAAVEQMTDYIYQQCMMHTSTSELSQAPLLRSLILILLIRQLLRRRFTFF